MFIIAAAGLPRSSLAIHCDLPSNVTTVSCGCRGQCKNDDFFASANGSLHPGLQIVCSHLYIDSVLQTFRSFLRTRCAPAIAVSLSSPACSCLWMVLLQLARSLTRLCHAFMLMSCASMSLSHMSLHLSYVAAITSLFYDKLIVEYDLGNSDILHTANRAQ